MPVTMAVTMPTAMLVIVFASAVVLVTARFIAHEVHRLPASAVLAAVVGPVTRVARGDTQVDRALLHGDRPLLNDDGLGVEHRRRLIADIDAAI